MALLHYLNSADYIFMALGVMIALLMIVMGGGEERRKVDRLDSAEPPPKVRPPGARIRRF
ncbi:MAG: hypothetical protein ACHP7A_04605 [Caulobacterales bacterium]|jgi:hypothetical protein